MAEQHQEAQPPADSFGDVHAWLSAQAEALPDRPWTIVHAKPRQDMRLAGVLSGIGVGGVVFRERRVRRYPGKGTQVSWVPLLPGYLFAVADHETHRAIYETGRVVRLIAVRDPERLAGELRSLILLVTRTRTPLVVRPELQPGRTVELRAGAFAGLRGVVLRRAGRCELVVNLELLGHCVAVTVPAEGVEAVPLRPKPAAPRSSRRSLRADPGDPTSGG